MFGLVRRNLPLLVALFVLANSSSALAAFMAAPEASAGSPFSVEFHGEPMAASFEADAWVLVPAAGAAAGLRDSATPESVSDRPLVASIAPAAGTGPVSPPAPVNPSIVCVPASAPQATGGILTAYLVREGRCLLLVPFLSGIFRPPRWDDVFRV